METIRLQLNLNKTFASPVSHEVNGVSYHMTVFRQWT